MAERGVVFIPSKGRAHNARRITEIWHQKDFNVHWMVEEDDHNKYEDAITGTTPITWPGTNTPRTFVHILKGSNRGIAYARAECVSLADDFNYKSIILSDDDIKPAKIDSNMYSLFATAQHPKVMGITARYSYHDLCLGPQIKHMDRVVLLATGTFRLVGLNVRNVMDMGNYDDTLEYAEDCDLFLRSLQEGFPWMVHLGTRSNSIGKRYEPGGMLDYAGGEANLKAKKREWHETLYQQYPDLVNDPANADFSKQNSIRIQWQKAYNKWLPDWRSWSSLHGGHIDNYLRNV